MALSRGCRLFNRTAALLVGVALAVVVAAPVRAEPASRRVAINNYRSETIAVWVTQYLDQTCVEVPARTQLRSAVPVRVSVEPYETVYWDVWNQPCRQGGVKVAAGYQGVTDNGLKFVWINVH